MTPDKRGYKSTEFLFKLTVVIVGGFLVGFSGLDPTYFWTGACALAGAYGLERTFQKWNGGPNHKRKEGMKNGTR